MPKDFSLQTETGISSIVFIVDEFGGFSSSLVDSLMERGLEIYYFGVEKKENFSYLLHKKNFSYLEELDEINGLSKVNYLFYFPKNNLNLLKSVDKLSDKFSIKVIIAAQNSFHDQNIITDLVNFKDADFRLVLFENLFGPRVVEGKMADIFYQAVNNKKILLNWNELNKFRPLFSKSLISEILRIFFLPDSQGKIYVLEPKKCTYREFLGYLKEIDPDIEVNYLDHRPKNESFDFPEEAEEIEIFDNLNEAVIETFEWFFRNKKSKEETSQIVQGGIMFSTEIVEDQKDEVIPLVESPESFELEKPITEPIFKFSEVIPEKTEKKFEPKIKQNLSTNIVGKVIFSILFFLLISVLFFGIPSALTIYTGLKGAGKFDQAKVFLDNGNLNDSLIKIKEGGASLNGSQKIFSMISPFLSLVGLDKKISVIEESFILLQEAGESTGSIIKTFQDISDLGQKFLNGSEVDWISQIESLNTNLLYAYEKASLAQSSLKLAKDGFVRLKKESQFDNISNYLPEVREKLLKGRNFLRILPNLLGLKERKTYLILFQNNLELRPTGGFIPAIGLINIENGKLISFEVSNIYQTDDQLKGQVEPPQKIKEVLGEKIWYFRDSNWDPDFSVSAQRALWFLDKETKISADGVLAVNLKVFKNILSKSGEITLADYSGEKINAENLENKAIQYSDTANMTGSKNRQEFMVSLVNAVFEKVKTLDSQKFINVEGIIYSALETKEIMLYSNDPLVQKGIVDLGWDGNLRNYQPKVESFNVFSDYLYINEANMGINKVNFAMKRIVNHEINIDELGKVQEKLTLEYENQSPSDNWPLGKYRNYLRVYLSQGTKLVSALTTDMVNNNIWIPIDSSLQEIFDEHGKTVFAFMVEIPAKSTKKFEITYNLEKGLDLSKKINSYLLLVQKQSGSYSDVYNLTFNSSKELVPLRVIPKAIVDNGKLIIGEKIDRDKIFQIDLAH